MGSKSGWSSVVLFGDSITQHNFGQNGWGAVIADKLQRKCDVLNRGFSGYNTRWNRIILPQLFPTSESVANVAAFVIFLGANDSNDKELNPGQHVPLEEFKENFTEMVKYLQSVGLRQERIILIGPPPCDVIAWRKCREEKGVPMAKDNAVTGLYNDKCREVATETSAQFVDIYSGMMQLPNWEAFLSDGLHLSATGSEQVFKQLWPVIDGLTAGLSQIFPEWDHVDVKDPQSTLKL